MGVVESMLRLLLGALGCALVWMSGMALGQRRAGVQKSIINYLGTNFILYDGCPEPACDSRQSECTRTISMIRNLYAHCVQSEEGQYVGCITDRINKKEFITLPKYATKCSAMCYESDPFELARIQRCPHRGFRQHDPVLQGLF